ncbi:hypothetical protein ACFSTD_18950 [Novosphingobium colocasiae]
MSERPGQPVTVGADPFSRRAVLALVVLGSALFVALLYMIGSGTGQGSANDGGGHAGSRGLTGYAAMADYLRGRGFAVRLVRNEGALRAPGLLVLTPGAYVDGKKLAKIVDARRGIGPTMVVTPQVVGAARPCRARARAPAGCGSSARSPRNGAVFWMSCRSRSISRTRANGACRVGTRRGFLASCRTAGR